MCDTYEVQCDIHFVCSYAMQIVQRILYAETSVKKKSHESCRTILIIRVPCGSVPSKSNLAESWKSFRTPTSICVNLYVYYILRGEIPYILESNPP